VVDNGSIAVALAREIGSDARYETELEVWALADGKRLALTGTKPKIPAKDERSATPYRWLLAPTPERLLAGAGRVFQWHVKRPELAPLPARLANALASPGLVVGGQGALLLATVGDQVLAVEAATLRVVATVRGAAAHEPVLGTDFLHLSSLNANVGKPHSIVRRVVPAPAADGKGEAEWRVAGSASLLNPNLASHRNPMYYTFAGRRTAKGTQFLAGDAEGGLTSWTLGDGTPDGEFAPEAYDKVGQGPVGCVLPLPKSELAVIACASREKDDEVPGDQEVCVLWDLAQRRKVADMGSGFSALLLPDGRVAVLARDGLVSVWTL
jgi:hypothetical protein